MSDAIQLSEKQLDAAAAIASVTHPDAGGIDVFIGTTRAEKRSDGIELVALDYEAYAEMAILQMNKLRDQVRQCWPVCRLALLHRVGRVAIGEASVVIAVSCPHRAQAFEACRFLIDELKKSVTIWKKEVWADGQGTWVKGRDVAQQSDMT